MTIKKDEVLPCIRNLFPLFNEEELLVAQNRLGDFLLKVYLDHLEELREDSNRKLFTEGVEYN